VRIFKRAVAIVVLGGVGAVGLASGAAAAEPDVTTPGWYWVAVSDTALSITDAVDSYPDFQGSGINFGNTWTSDALDGVFYYVSATYDGGLIADLRGFTSVSAVYVDGGVTTVVGGQSVDFGGGNTFDVTLTLTIQGSYARWDLGYVSTGVGDVNLLDTYMVGNLGSGGDAHYVAVGTNALVTDDQNNGDPVIGVHFDSPGAWAYDVTDGDDNIAVNFAGPASTFILSLQSYDPCSFDAAIAAMTALAPTFPATFGGDNDLILSPTCLAIAPPAEIEIGASTNQILTFTQDPRLAARWDISDPLASDWFRSVALDLPAGLTLATEFDAGTGAPRLRLTGTAPAGTHVVHVLSYYGDGTDSYEPVVSTFTVEVVLAATGTESANLVWLALGLIGLGAGLVVVARRVRPRER
jgi:LPXTG-motif cell wall-anchored protein